MNPEQVDAMIWGLEQAKPIKMLENPASLYKVEILGNKEDYLEYEIPFNEQSPQVKERVMELIESEGLFGGTIGSKEMHLITPNGAKLHWTEVIDGELTQESMDQAVKGWNNVHGADSTKWMPYGEAMLNDMSGEDLYEAIGNQINLKSNKVFEDFYASFEPEKDRLLLEAHAIQKAMGQSSPTSTELYNPEQLAELKRIEDRLDDIDAEIADYSDKLGSRDEQASNELQHYGIPGIRFDDGMSRGGKRGDSQNYVSFDDEDMIITHRNGEPVTPEIQENVRANFLAGNGLVNDPIEPNQIVRPEPPAIAPQTDVPTIPLRSDAPAQGRSVGAGETVNVQGRDVPVTQTKDSVRDVVDSNYAVGGIVGEKSVPISEVIIPRYVTYDDTARVSSLADSIVSDNGYIERLIIDTNGNVIEGQHRAQALEKIGATDVPAVVVQDLTPSFEAVVASGVRPEQARQVVQEVFVIKNRGDVVSDYETGGYDKAYQIAENSLIAPKNDVPVIPASRQIQAVQDSQPAMVDSHLQERPVATREHSFLKNVGDVDDVNAMDIVETPGEIPAIPLVKASDLIDRGAYSGIVDTSDSSMGIIEYVNGVPVFSTKEGGDKYGHQLRNIDAGNVFANADPGMITAAMNKADAAMSLPGVRGDSPIFLPQGMGGASLDFSTMPTSVQVPYSAARMSKKDKAALDKRIRQGRLVTTGQNAGKYAGAIPNWPGIDDPNILQYLTKIGGDRGNVSEALNEFYMKDTGAMSTSMARYLHTDPGQFDPQLTNVNQAYEVDIAGTRAEGAGGDHSTYPYNVKGNRLGAFGPGFNLFELNPMFRNMKDKAGNITGERFADVERSKGRIWTPGQDAVPREANRAAMSGTYGIFTTPLVDSLIQRGIISPD
tara:strand:- start:465 stop:3128 length:2664 start_codon:yes stop_codon:yes gene_type:complete